MEKSKIEHNGIVYYRHRLGYYMSGRRGGKTLMLHRVLWEEAYGPIPEKHHIHHKDRNPSNNDLANLECMSEADHCRLHFKEKAIPGFTEEGQRKAKEWHRSPAGIEWHRQHGRATAATKPWFPAVCTVCGSDYQTQKPGKSIYCSRVCNQQALRNRRKAQYGTTYSRERYERRRTRRDGAC